MTESALLAGPLEPTNEAVRDRQDCRHQVVPGIPSPVRLQLHLGHADQSVRTGHDNFDLTSSHVLPALIRKFHDARLRGLAEVTVWGSGRPRREFLHVDDLADACLFLMERYEDDSHVNVGTGTDLTIEELAITVRDIVQGRGRHHVRRIEARRSRPASFSTSRACTTWAWRQHSRFAGRHRSDLPVVSGQLTIRPAGIPNRPGSPR